MPMGFREYLALGFIISGYSSLAGAVHMPSEHGECLRMFRGFCLYESRCDETDLWEDCCGCPQCCACGM